MKEIKEYIDDEKKEIVFHLNVETIKANIGKYPVMPGMTPKDYLKSILNSDFELIEKKTESLIRLMASANVTKEDLKKLLLKMRDAKTQ